MKLSLALIVFSALSIGDTNAAATVLRGRHRQLQQQQQGYTTTTVDVTESTPTSGIPNCTPGQRVQFNAQTQQWECFSPLGAVVVGQGTDPQDIPDNANDINGVDNGATIIQPGGTTTVEQGPNSPTMSTPTTTTVTTTGSSMTTTGSTMGTTSVTSPGVTTPATNGAPVTTGLSSCTSGQRAVFNAQLQMWECYGASAAGGGSGATVTTINGNAVGGGNTITVGTPPSNNNPAFSATAPGGSKDDKKSKKKSKKSKKDSNDGFTLNGGSGAQEANVVAPTSGCAPGEIAIYAPGDSEWRCVQNTGNPDMP